MFDGIDKSGSKLVFSNLDHCYLTSNKQQSEVLYFTIVNVFVNGMPIQDQAYNVGVSTHQVNRRLHDGLHALTLIMNGEGL